MFPISKHELEFPAKQGFTHFTHSHALCTPQHAERLGASRLVMVNAQEWERGMVMVKDLAAFSQGEVAVDSLI